MPLWIPAVSAGLGGVQGTRMGMRAARDVRVSPGFRASKPQTGRLSVHVRGS